MSRLRRNQKSKIIISLIGSEQNYSQYLQVLGPFNTGTNLMYSLLSKKSQSYKIDFMYKHEINFTTLTSQVQDNRKKYIIMYKPIYNWLYSMQKASYDLKFMGDNIYGKVLYNGKIYKNIIEVYNSYFQMYSKLATNPNVVIINYYKLISDDGLNYLNKKLDKIGFTNLDINEFNEALEKPAKNHGQSVKNASEALERYNRVNEEYKKKVFNSDLVHSLNANLYKIFDDL
jgi:hypothetical protein